MILKFLNRVAFAEEHRGLFIARVRYSGSLHIFSSQEQCFAVGSLQKRNATQKPPARELLKKQKSAQTQAFRIPKTEGCTQNEALRKQKSTLKQPPKYFKLMTQREYGTQKELVIADGSVHETVIEHETACAHVCQNLLEHIQEYTACAHVHQDPLEHIQEYTDNPHCANETPLKQETDSECMCRIPSRHEKRSTATWVKSCTVESLVEQGIDHSITSVRPPCTVETPNVQNIHELEWRWLHSLDYPSLLRWCGDGKYIHIGMWVHHDLCCNKMEGDAYFGVVLVEMYLKCEASEDAHSIFFSLSVHSVFSWNVVIRSYTSQGQDAEALQCLQRIHGEASSADKYTFVSLLSSCVNLTDIGTTQRIHACIVGGLHQSDVIVGNALINAYAKCSSLSEARTIFDNMSERDSFSWDTLIGAHVQHKLHNEALCLFYQQQHQGVLPTRITYVAILDACASQGVTGETSYMLARIFGSEYRTSVNVETAIVNFFSKVGRSEDAWIMFCSMNKRNVYSWNAIFASSSDFGQSIGVFELYSRMLGEGVLPNEEAFINVISLCASPKALAFGKGMHACVINSQNDKKVAVNNALIGMYSRCLGLKGACRAFDWMLERNIVTWTTMVAAFVEHGQAMLAIEFFNQMLGEGLLPDKIMLIGILDACASLHSPTRLKQLHIRIVGMGLESDLEVRSSLASMYGKCGGLKAAQRMFDSIFCRNTTLWSAMISAYARHNHANDAIQFFHQMKQEGILPNEVTFFSVLDACSKASALMEGRRLHAYLSLNAFKEAVSIKTALIDMYGKCGSLEESQRVFDDVVTQDIVLLTAMIAAYTQNGRVKQALLLFDKALQKGIKPDEVAFINVLSMCSHAGLVDDGHRYFSSMNRDYDIAPTIHHYSCMIDLFGRAGCLTEAENMIMSMPFTATALQWMTLLSACRRQLDVERGERAARRVMLLDPKNSIPYVELSNIYGALHREADAVEILNKMKELL